MAPNLCAGPCGGDRGAAERGAEGAHNAHRERADCTAPGGAKWAHRGCGSLAERECMHPSVNLCFLLLHLICTVISYFGVNHPAHERVFTLLQSPPSSSSAMLLTTGCPAGLPSCLPLHCATCLLPADQQLSCSYSAAAGTTDPRAQDEWFIAGGDGHWEMKKRREST